MALEAQVTFGGVTLPRSSYRSSVMRGRAHRIFDASLSKVALAQ